MKQTKNFLRKTRTPGQMVYVWCAVCTWLVKNRMTVSHTCLMPGYWLAHRVLRGRFGLVGTPTWPRRSKVASDQESRYGDPGRPFYWLTQASTLGFFGLRKQTVLQPLIYPKRSSPCEKVAVATAVGSQSKKKERRLEERAFVRAGPVARNWLGFAPSSTGRMSQGNVFPRANSNDWRQKLVCCKLSTFYLRLNAPKGRF